MTTTPKRPGAMVLGLTAGAAMLLAAGAVVARPKAPEPSKPVDLGRFYSGVWREIGRRPMSITNGCVAGATEYRVVGPDKVRVRDTCRKGTPSGPVQSVGGPATILDPGVNAKLHVHYRLWGFFPIVIDYWVLDHDEDYKWFISADPAFKNLWIYTRDPDVSAAERQRLVDKARALGYDVTKLEFPAQP